jgi:hypothetical protein
MPLNASIFDDAPGTAAVIGAVAMATPSNACMIATPTIPRAIPEARNHAEKAPTAAAIITMKKPIPLPSSRTIVVQIVTRDVTSAIVAPAR